jgi:hypothetical protein
MTKEVTVSEEITTPALPASRLLIRIARFYWLPTTICLLFLGALLWAKAKDPFQRVEFLIKPLRSRPASGIAVVPKTARVLPLIIYAHDSGQTTAKSGIVLRQLAELGMVAVGIDYNENGDAAFQNQLAELYNFLSKQHWANTNSVAWVGEGEGGRKLWQVCKTSKLKPKMMVICSANSLSVLGDLEAPCSFDHPVLLLKTGESRDTGPKELNEAVAAMREKGVPMSLRTLISDSGDFTAERTMVFRAIGEACRARLFPDSFSGYRSIMSYESAAKPLWLYWLPAFVWISFCLGCWYRSKKMNKVRHSPMSRLEKVLRATSIALGLVASAEILVHAVTPRLVTSDRTIAIADYFLIASKCRKDFYQLKDSFKGRRLKSLLEHVELANYNREIINWKLPDAIYSEFVLSPRINPDSNDQIDWRRPLWENFYPRIRREFSTQKAAEIVVRHLREQITIDPLSTLPANNIEDIWIRQITSERGFHLLYVAALRSVGIGARLSPHGEAEMWEGEGWKPAPKPLILERLAND